MFLYFGLTCPVTIENVPPTVYICIAQAIHYGIVCYLRRLVNIYMPIHRRDVEWTMVNKL